MELPNEIKVNVSIKDIPEVKKQLENADKEIEKLNEELEHYKEKENSYIYYQQEVSRLLNIMYELQKYLEDLYYGRNGYKDTDVIDIDSILDKLQELKGDGSNE